MSVAHHHDTHDRPVSQMNRVPARNIGHRRYLRQRPGHAIHSAPDAYGFFWCGVVVALVLALSKAGWT